MTCGAIRRHQGVPKVVYGMDMPIHDLWDLYDIRWERDSHDRGRALSGPDPYVGLKKEQP